MKEYLPAINSSPIIEKLSSPVTPEELYGHYAHLENTSLLNSSLETDAGRYSFIGLDPFLVLTGKNNKLRLRFEEHELTLKNSPFDCLSSLISTYNTKNATPLPFTAGGIGYFSYDLKNTIEHLPQQTKDDLLLPDIYFVLYRTLLIWDNLNPGEFYISVLDIKSNSYKKPVEIIKEIKKTIKSSSLDTLPKPKRKGHRPLLKSNFTKNSYIKSVKKVIDYIRAGDIYQACLSQRFKTECSVTPYELYRNLNKINPSPFGAYLNFEEAQIISSSPELFLRMRNNTIETRPMKGTRKRGKNITEDRKLKTILLKSKKDAAELAMIVDVERNDFGKVCIPGSIKVAEHRRIETYPTVFQTISIINGLLGKTINPVDIIKASFPGGSISGCPKIRAMEIIGELEPTQRHVYTGSIGYISFHDTMDLNIAIRTMIMKGKDVYFQAGGGIVSDSDPETEYTETIIKAKALVESLHL